jgi:cytochrome P450
MITERRFFLSGLVGMMAGARAFPQSGQRHDSPSRIPQIPDPAGSSGPDDTPLPPRADPKRQLKEEQKELRRDVDRLVKLAQDLKEESDKTPETDVLSLSLVKKAEDIEKLARQIRDLIRAG